ncbi:MAG: ATP-binding protein [Wujia sp.]
MYFSKLLLKDFGKFHNKEMDLQPGLNVVYGDKHDGKSTVADFMYGTLYGISASPESDADDLQQRKPVNARDFSGKAYLQQGDKRYLIERSFLKGNKTMQLLDISSGRQIQVKNKNTLYNTLTQVDKKAFSDAHYIRAYEERSNQAETLNQFIANLATSGASNYDCGNALETLRKKKQALDVSVEDRNLEALAQELKPYEGDEEALAKVREEIAENDQEFAIETAKRKREARRLIETEKGVTYEENEELAEGLDELQSKSVFLDADLLKDYKPEKKWHEKWWVVAGTALFVWLVIAVLVWVLPFDNGVRQLFMVCTALFEVLTILDCLHAKGVFNEENQAPTEEEFRQIVYDLERKNEAYEEVEIDMSFAKEFLERKEALQAKERELLERKNQVEEIEARVRACKQRKKEIEREGLAITYAINTIHDIAKSILEKWDYVINGRIAEILQIVTGNTYQDARLSSKLRLSVLKEGTYMDIEEVPRKDFEQIRFAVMLCVSATMAADDMPILIDGLPRLPQEQLEQTMRWIEKLPAQQIIVLTDDKRIPATCSLTNMS